MLAVWSIDPNRYQLQVTTVAPCNTSDPPHSQYHAVHATRKLTIGLNFELITLPSNFAQSFKQPSIYQIVIIFRVNYILLHVILLHTVYILLYSTNYMSCYIIYTRKYAITQN